MKRILINSVKVSLFVFTLFYLFYSCKKDENENTDPNPENNIGYILENLNTSTFPQNQVELLYRISYTEDTYFNIFPLGDFKITENEIEIADYIEFQNSNSLSIDFKTVLLIDVSLNNSFNIPDIQFAVKQFINQLQANEKMAIYTFSGEYTKIIDFTHNKEQLKQSLQLLSPGILTRNLNYATSQSLEKFNQQIGSTINNGTVVLITGGPDDANLVSTQEVISSRGEKQIYTINTKADSTASYEDIKEVSNGYYGELSNITELAGELLKLRTYIKSTLESYYEITYTSFQLGDKDNEVKISLRNNPNSGSDATAVFQFNSVNFHNLENGIIFDVLELQLQLNSTRELLATSHDPQQTPEFHWSVSDSGVVSIDAETGNPVRFRAHGNVGDTATIFVEDIGNGFSVSLPCKIIEPYILDEFQDTRDGKTYDIVMIGNQWWFAENLDFEIDSSCYYNNSEEYAEFGRLYKWQFAINSCPQGWHVSTDDDWLNLESSVDSQVEYGDPEWLQLGDRGFDAGGNLKDNSNEYWLEPNVGATNSFNFNSLPSGYYFPSFNKIGSEAHYWSISTESTTNYNLIRILNKYYKTIERYNSGSVDSKKSVRCVKDDD